MACIPSVQRTALFWLAIQISILPATLATQCFFTDGSNANSEMQPCFPEQKNSACCGIDKTGDQENDICTTTGLCLTQVNPYRGMFLLNACTDRSWGSGCPQLNETYCPLDTTMQQSSGIHVLPCPALKGGLNHWCCSLDGSDCCDKAFLLDVGTVMLPNTSTSSSNSSSTTAFTTSFATTTVTASAESASDNNTSSKTAAVGAGLGAGLGACLAATIGAIIFQRRMYQKKLQEMEQLNATTIYHCSHGNSPEYPAELPLNQKPAFFELEADRGEGSVTTQQ